MGMQTIHQLVLSATMFTVLLTGGILSPRTATAATYYVATNGTDANTGSQSQPFRTITKGLSRLSSGDTLYIRQGTYDEQINPVTGAIPNGTSWATATTIVGYPGETVIFDRINMGDGGGFAWMIFTNLTVASVYLGADTHHIRIDHCDIVNASRMAISGGGGFHEFTNNKIHGAYYYGTYWAGHDTIFDGNDFYDHGGFAIHIYNKDDTTVSNNIVRNNRIYNNGLIRQDASSGGVILSHGSNNQAYNNLVYGNFAGFQIDYDCVGCQVYNNTIYGNTYHGVQVGRAVNTIVKNNIIYNNRSAITNLGDSGAVIDPNFTSDPQFENPSAGNFHLKSGSPAKTASDTGREVGAYANGGGPGSGEGSTIPAPRNLKVISVGSD